MKSPLLQIWIVILVVIASSPGAFALSASADLDGDGEVGHGDLISIVHDLKTKSLGGDISVDGKITSEDVLELLRQWRNHTVLSHHNVVVSIRNSSNQPLARSLLEDVSVSKGFVPVTGAEIQNAFITFDRITVQGPMGPPQDVFNASAQLIEEIEMDDTSVQASFAFMTGPEPVRRIDLAALDNLDQALGGIQFPEKRLNWIRLHIVEGYPNTYVMTVDGDTDELKVPSNKFRIITAGNKVDISQVGLTNLSIDFDAAKSIVGRGGGGFILKPVTKLVVNEVNMGKMAGDFE